MLRLLFRAVITDMHKVTVLMAVYNGQHYLRDAIDSLLAQTFRDFELLIINDGSTDSTQAIIQSYDDPRIRLVNNEQNLGLARSLNRGLGLAQGELIARQDADDISEPERLARQVAFLDASPEVVLAGTWYREIDAQGVPTGQGRLPCDHTQIRWHLLFYCPFVHSAVMLRKSVVLEQIGFYNEKMSYSMDYELWLRIAQRLPVANLNEYLVRVRVNPHSMTETYGDKKHEGFNIRVATVARLLGGDLSDTASNELRFNRMTKLLIGIDSGASLPPETAKHIAGDILTLHTAFFQSNNINERVYRRHRARLKVHLSKRLVELADSQVHLHSRDAGLLLLQASRMWWGVLTTPACLRLLIKLVAGKRLLTKYRLARKKLA
jgi:glycosyltransferase involved in cell wall biosynthesis